MKKYNKKQKEAVDHLKYNLDELSNKPRRLYSALRDFAEAFLDKERRDFPSIINNIDEAETLFYSRNTDIGIVTEILSLIRKRKIALESRMAKEEFIRKLDKNISSEEKESRWYSYCEGVKDMTNKAMKSVWLCSFDELDDKYERYQ